MSSRVYTSSNHGFAGVGILEVAEFGNQFICNLEYSSPETRCRTFHVLED